MTAMTFHVARSDVRLIRLMPHEDARGTFTRAWSLAAFEEAGIAFRPVEASTSLTRARGTIRGMHFQRTPREEAKLVRCARGRIWDVVTDLRPRSPDYRKSFGFELGDGTALYIPRGFAHGFQALCDDVAVEYLIDERYVPECADGFRYDDREAAIDWPLPATVLSGRDRAWPPLATRSFWAERLEAST